MHINREGLVLNDYQQMAEMEARYYDKSHIAAPEEAFAWAKRFPWTEAVLFDEEKGGQIAGFLDLFPISDSLYDKLATGAYNDADLKADDVLDLESATPGVYAMVLCCVVIEEEYRHTDALKLLLRHQIDVYEGYRKKGITFDRIITDNVTENGERLSQKLGFSKITDTLYDSVIYAGRYDEFTERVAQWPSGSGH